MGKMPAGLKRYWASRRRGKKKGGKVMARRTGRKGKRRSYGRLRKAGRRAASIFSKPTRLMGFKKDGFHVSDAIIVGGLAATALLPCSSAPESSAVGALMGRGQYSGYTMEQKVVQALNNACSIGLGVDMQGQRVAGGYSGVGALAVGSGVAMKVVGRAINPMMRGSAVKL